MALQRHQQEATLQRSSLTSIINKHNQGVAIDKSDEVKDIEHQVHTPWQQ